MLRSPQRDKDSYTRKAYWIVPPTRDNIYTPVCDIDFTSASSKYKNLNIFIDTGKKVEKPMRFNEHAASTEREIAGFYSALSKTTGKPAILSIVDGYSEKYVPASLDQDKYPLVLTEMQRSGRVTASRLGAVCHTNINKPSHSLIKTTCYPEATKFVSIATNWGNECESKAKQAYTSHMKEKHNKFQVSDSGFGIDPEHPHLGGSPDGVVMYVWDEALQKATEFFHLCVMLELVGNYYTPPQTSGSSLVDTVQEEASPENSEPERWCYCGGKEEGEMICCNDERCKIQWYHFD
ncbi:hypothetical protein AWC38_SpisGene19074 [Stylophora pistillata]|uniref:YqaJ viral recombinase domain-containing protein n=1 Tax=Stylophora pistillata TaxID=50429 RepID=A0A2B4RHJ1_STYPI|nr:hypothetical protein AWC38_SpisGene19074 [Stylophora pistillata]